MNQNRILDTDSYKASHWLQYPPGTQGVFNYLESRGGKYDRTVFFGLQYILKAYLSKPITMAEVEEAKLVFTKHGVPFNYEGWKALVTELGGKLPLRIKAVAEGTVVPTGVPLLTCESTDSRFFWVVGWFETLIMRLWYPITVATLSYHVKQSVKKYLDLTCDNPDAEINFKLHDFGSRGVSSRESAAIGGAAHLVNFMGTDTVPALLLASEYYDADMAGFSIPAAEHSTITSWGQDQEEAAYENMIKQFSKPGSIYAVVSDSYDIHNAVDNIWGGSLKQKVIDSGGTLVIRPDSGDPVFMVSTILHSLSRTFGYTTNKKGFKVLKNVRIIQGDGLNPETIEAILKSTKTAGFGCKNVAFGMGGGLLQQVNRDTQRFAYKCSSIDVYEEESFGTGKLCGVVRRDVSKNPVSDPGKKSKAGRIGASHGALGWHTVKDDSPDNVLQVRYENGALVGETTFAEVRERAK